MKVNPRQAEYYAFRFDGQTRKLKYEMEQAFINELDLNYDSNVIDEVDAQIDKHLKSEKLVKGNYVVLNRTGIKDIYTPSEFEREFVPAKAQRTFNSDNDNDNNDDNNNDNRQNPKDVLTDFGQQIFGELFNNRSRSTRQANNSGKTVNLSEIARDLERVFNNNNTNNRR